MKCPAPLGGQDITTMIEFLEKFSSKKLLLNGGFGICQFIYICQNPLECIN